jgi:predicted HicB family RNase H-like nuclease
MTRPKARPPVVKPVFDADSVLSFAALETRQPDHNGHSAGADPDRVNLTLNLKPEVVARLKAEAARKEKSLEQVVEKLVTKHLGKH